MHINFSIQPQPVQLLGNQLPTLAEGMRSDDSTEEETRERQEQGNLDYALEQFPSLSDRILNDSQVAYFEAFLLENLTYRELRRRVDERFAGQNYDSLENSLNQLYNHLESRLSYDNRNITERIRNMPAQVFETQNDSDEDDFI